jgi:hypothetical protein
MLRVKGADDGDADAGGDIGAAVTDNPRGRIRDIQVGRFRIILDQAGPRGLARCWEEIETSVRRSVRKAAYSNGRGERITDEETDIIDNYVQEHRNAPHRTVRRVRN